MSDSRLSTARPTENRSGASPSRKPNAVPSASRCGPGRRSGGPGTARTSAGAPRTRAPSPTRRRPSGQSASRRVLHQILQQRALANPGLPAQHERPARTRAHARRELIQRAHSLRRPSSCRAETGTDIATGRQGRSTQEGAFHRPFNAYMPFCRIRPDDDLLGKITPPSRSGRWSQAGARRRARHLCAGVPVTAGPGTPGAWTRVFDGRDGQAP